MLRREFFKQAATFGLGAMAGELVHPYIATASPSGNTSALPGDESAEVFEIRIGNSLLRIFSNGSPSEIIRLIPALRTQLAAEGLAMPLVRIRSFDDLPGNQYRILVRGRLLRCKNCEAATLGENESRHPPDARPQATDDILVHLERTVRRHQRAFAVSDSTGHSCG